MMTSGFWGINLISDKEKKKAKTIVFYSVITMENCIEIEEQLSVLYPNNFIILHYIKYENYEQLKDVEEFKQS